MHNKDFSVKCHNCQGEVTSYIQKISYILSPKAALQESQTIELSCGCVIDFPDWQIDLNSGWCKIVDFTGNVFIEFLDEELIMEDEED